MTISAVSVRYVLCGIGIIIVSMLIARQYSKTPDTIITKYYQIINEQEKIRDDVRVAASELATITACSKKSPVTSSIADDCVRRFYEAYALTHGGEAAFAHLARLQRENPQVLPSCHYIAHGIGHAVLRLNDGNPYKAFAFMQSGNYFKNIATCASGFFHGVIEEIAKDETDPDTLVRLLRPVCASDLIKNRGGCYHGVGHAAAIQTMYETNAALDICDRISNASADQFNCFSGVFMEFAHVVPRLVSITNGTLTFTFCDSLDRKYQPACYIEHSVFIELFAKDGTDYARNITFCKNIPDAINRMACVKLFAIRAVRISHYADVDAMCSGTKTYAEQVTCTAIVADRIASSLGGSHKSIEFRAAARDVCGTLNAYRALQCRYIVDVEARRLFFTSATDLQLPSVAQLSTYWFRSLSRRSW